jgi:hypothetical protein
MKVVSHSEISTYLECQKKWDLQYNHGIKFDNIHFQFGSMGHKALETRVIPDELLYPELKEAFGISSWSNYFTPIFEELDIRMSDYELIYTEHKVENETIKGVIDAVWKHKTNGRYLITDYKFSTSDKGQEDVLLDEQMYIYAVLLAVELSIPLEQIDIGYINIPKKEMDNPRVLKSGALSKDKAQNVTYDKYVEKIHELGLNIEDYEDFLSEIHGRTLLTIEYQPINIDMIYRIMNNIDLVVKDMQKGYILEKCSFMCKRCEYLQYCKYGKDINSGAVQSG